MLALHLPQLYLDQLFVAPEYQGQSLGRRLLAFTRQHLPDEIWLRCVRENEKAWRWYEREGFVFEKEAGRADDRVCHEILSMEEGRNGSMMKLYWSPRSRSFSALWLMEETGQPYERVLTDISTGAQKTPEYLAINPMGKVPALRDGEATLAEAAAICAYVAERYPEAKLAPPLGDPVARQISLLAVLLARLHRARDGAGRDQDRDESGRRRLGRCAAGVRRARRRARKGTVDSRRDLLGRRYRDRLGAEFRGAAVQDGAVAPVIRPLHRSLRGAAGVPARRELSRRGKNLLGLGSQTPPAAASR